MAPESSSPLPTVAKAAFVTTTSVEFSLAPASPDSSNLVVDMACSVCRVYPIGFPSMTTAELNQYAAYVVMGGPQNSAKQGALAEQSLSLDT